MPICESDHFRVSEYVRDTVIVENKQDGSIWTLSKDDCFNLAILLLDYVLAKGS